MGEEVKRAFDVSVEFWVNLKDVVELPEEMKNPYFPDWAAKDYEIIAYVSFTENFYGDGTTLVRIHLYDKDAISVEHARLPSSAYYNHFLVRRKHPLVFDKLLEIAEEKIEGARSKEKWVFVEKS